MLPPLSSGPWWSRGSTRGAAVGQLAPRRSETHGVEPLEDVAVLTMLRGAAVLFDEALNLLEAGDHPLLARGPRSDRLSVDRFDAELFQERVVLCR